MVERSVIQLAQGHSGLQFLNLQSLEKVQRFLEVDLLTTDRVMASRDSSTQESLFVISQLYYQTYQYKMLLSLTTVTNTMALQEHSSQKRGKSQTKSQTQSYIIYLLEVVVQNRMFEPFRYIWNTISQQVNDQITIIRQIADYYRQEIKETLKTRSQMNAIKSVMKKAETYSDWKTLANQYDRLPVIEQQVNEVYSPYYDFQYLQELVKAMNQAREDDDALKIIQIIRSHSNRNIANVNCPFLYRHAYNRSKRLIEQYQQQLAKGMQTILKADIPQSKKLQFFGEVRHAVGRTALLLSGGAIMGMYHIGVIQTLIQADCLPKVITGSSAGSIIASVVATHTREEMFQQGTFNFSAFANQKNIALFQKIQRAGRQGCVLDIKVLQQFLKDNIGEYTFQEAYDKFGVILNITVTGSSQYDSDRLLNYLTAPNVLIWSASAASCAIPFIYGATDLFCKDHNGKISKYTLMNRKFVDGSIGHDLPMNQISILFNVNNFIVSQTNPWVTPFMDYTEDLRGISNPVLQPFIIILHRVKEFILSEMRHRVGQIAYIFPNAITKFLNLLTQSYVGDITIWPEPRLQDYLRILQNPTSLQSIMSFIKLGRQRTYPKIHHIKSTMFIEKQIEKNYRRIRNTSRLHFLVTDKEIQEAGEAEFIMKRVLQDEKQWEQDEENFEMPNQQGETRRLFKKIDWTRIISTQDDDQRLTSQANRGNKFQKYRNSSFLLPREKSFEQ